MKHAGASMMYSDSHKTRQYYKEQKKMLTEALAALDSSSEILMIGSQSIHLARRIFAPMEFVTASLQEY